MHHTDLPAYDLMMAAVDRGQAVALIPTTDADGASTVYMRHIAPSPAEDAVMRCDSPLLRVAFAKGLCEGSRQMARRRGLTPLS
jgi:hypothetical protein